MPKNIKAKKEVGKAKKGIPISWFVLTIIIAVVLSFIISLVVFNISYASAQKYSVDSGTIVVQIQPEFADNQGKIIVQINKEASS